MQKVINIREQTPHNKRHNSMQTLNYRGYLQFYSEKFKN